VVHWPAGITEGGKIDDRQAFHLIDIMPTLCDLAETDYPSKHNGNSVKPAPGISMVPYWKGQVAQPEARTLYWQHLNHSAVQDGKWKLVSLDDRDSQRWELYDLSADRSETENVAAAHPEIVSRLREKWSTWAEESNVVPFPEDRAKPKPNPFPIGKRE
jgi:arylsulfatase